VAGRLPWTEAFLPLLPAIASASTNPAFVVAEIKRKKRVYFIVQLSRGGLLLPLPRHRASGRELNGGK
jgi:hypothetical protein